MPFYTLYTSLPAAGYNSILDDVLSMVHWLFAPPVIVLILYFELMDEGERWYEEFSTNHTLPGDAPSHESLCVISMLTLVSHNSDNLVS